MKIWWWEYNRWMYWPRAIEQDVSGQWGQQMFQMQYLVQARIQYVPSRTRTHSVDTRSPSRSLLRLWRSLGVSSPCEVFLWEKNCPTGLWGSQTRKDLLQQRVWHWLQHHRSVSMHGNHHHSFIYKLMLIASITISKLPWWPSFGPVTLIKDRSALLQFQYDCIRLACMQMCMQAHLHGHLQFFSVMLCSQICIFRFRHKKTS